jgi:hypothetical protein
MSTCTWPKSCAKCGRDIYPSTWDVPAPNKHYGRGLCSADHQAARKTGELVDFDRRHYRRDELLEEVALLRATGLTNRLSNLRWDTVSSNRLDTVRHGMHPLVLRTHCPLGHELKAPNLRTKPLPSGRQSRQCLSCARALRRVHYHRKVNGIELDMKILSDAKYAQIMERAA